jgi:hypothetical protein
MVAPIPTAYPAPVRRYYMRSMFRSALPFAAMLALALGSVVFSCATAGARGDGKPFFVNTGTDAQGRNWTVQALERVDRVMLIDEGDRSKRTELEPGQWRYDRASTELVLLSKSPYAKAVFHVEGKAERPARFVLRDVAAGEDPFVAVEGRLAIKGFDYTWDAPRSSIVFREDFDPETMEYLISYDTFFGGINSIGNRKPGDNGDAYAYLEVQHYTESSARKSRESTTDYFLDPSSFEGGKPGVIRRAPTPEEKAAAAGAVIPVIKSRIEASDAAVSKEVGFDARTPAAITAGGKTYPGGGKFIEERAEGGRLLRAVSEFYTPVGVVVDGFNSLMLSFGPDRPAPDGPKDERLMIERKTLDVGLAVKLERGWGITSGPLPSAGAEGKPEAVALALFRWEDKGVFFELSCADALRGDAEALVRSIVEYRKKGR